MREVRTLADYKKLVGTSSINEIGTFALSHLKQELHTELKVEDSTFALELKLLPEEQKSSLIAALIANESIVFEEFLLPGLSRLNLGILVQSLARIAEHQNSDPVDCWLNPTINLLIAKILQANDDDPAANARNARILQSAMQQIPESKIHIKAKIALCKEINYFASKEISDYSYNESLIPLKMNRFSGTITIKEFKTAIQATPLDYSTYLMLTLGLLQNALAAQPDLQASLNAIRQLYLNIQYEEAIAKVTALATKHQVELGEELFELITNKSAQLVEVEIHKNYPRRFFENRLSQLHLGLNTALDSINKISQYFGQEVHTIKMAETAILGIPFIADGQMHSRHRQLTSQSPLFQLHDRMDKSGFSDKDMERCGMVLNQEVLTKNKGALTSNAPNFYDELSEKEMRNRVVDITSTCEDDALYSFSRPRSAFIASLSGHSFLIVAALERYMQAYAQDKNLQIDINNYIKSVISVYLSHGYHSFFEVTDVFREPVVQEIFARFNVVLDLNWQDDLVEKASRDTQEYAKALCLRKILRTSIEMPSFFARPARHSSLKEELQGECDEDSNIRNNLS